MKPLEQPVNPGIGFCPPLPVLLVCFGEMMQQPINPLIRESGDRALIINPSTGGLNSGQAAQTADAAADQPAIAGLRQDRQTVSLQGLVHGVRQVSEGIQQRTIKIKNDCLQDHVSSLPFSS